MPDWSDDEFTQISTTVIQEISAKAPSIKVRRMTTTGGTRRPYNLDLDLSYFTDNVSRVREVILVEWPYRSDPPVYRNKKWKEDEKITMETYSCPSTGLEITAVADNGDGITVNVTLDVSGTDNTDHELQTNDVVTIVGTTSYNDTYVITRVSASVFKITATYVASETGNIGEIVGLTLAEDHTCGDTAASNTMNPDQEQVTIQGMIAHAWEHWLEESRDEVNNAITTIGTAETAIGLSTARVTQALADVASGRTEAAKVSDIVDDAATEIGLIKAEVDQAVTDLDSGRALLNTNTIVGKASLDYISQANGELNTAVGFFRSAQSYLGQAKADESIAASYAGLAGRELQVAATNINKGAAYLSEVNARLNAATKIIQLSQRECERKMALYRKELLRLEYEYKNKMSRYNRLYAR